MISKKLSILPGGGKASGGPAAKLQLTSLVDMMVILVVFLLKSFSADAQLVSPASGLELPLSAIETPITDGLVIEVGTQVIRVGGVGILNLSSLTEANTSSLGTLAAALTQASDDQGTTPVLIQADKRIPYDRLGKVLEACSLAGYNDVALVVMGEES